MSQELACQILCFLNPEKAMIVGGAVRDKLLGLEPKDYDVATILEPDEVKRRLVSHFDIIPTGLDHGTVTVYDHETGDTVEVTTLREDVSTDGRRATTKFTTDWRKDAMRRDFTINALYMDINGDVTDFGGGGLRDIDEDRLTFVGDPAKRIEEDYLRILRAIRFISERNFDIDQDEINVMTAYAGRVSTHVSVERIFTELKRIVTGRYANKALALHQHVFDNKLPLFFRPDRIACFQQYIDLESQCGERADAIARLSFLFSEIESDLAVFKPSRIEYDRFENISNVVYTTYGTTSRQLHARFGYDIAIRGLISHQAAYPFEDNLPHPLSFVESQYEATRPNFPIKGKDLVDLGFKPSPLFGMTINHLEHEWYRSDCTKTREQLLNAFFERSN